jgi:quercetin dioxygenase-like cupin family protein
MEVIRFDQITSLENSGVVSKQHIFPENSNSERVTITEVTMPPGSINPRHSHESSEQIWMLRASARARFMGFKTLAL